MSCARYFVYRYDGNPGTDEVGFDPNGETQIPKQGDVMNRKGSGWKISSVLVETTATNSGEVPIFRVFLEQL